MTEITSIQELNQLIHENKLALIFISSRACSVCHADLPRVKQIAKEYEVPLYGVEIEENPEIVGQYNTFSAPTVILYFEGNEIHRQVRIIDFDELTYRIEQVLGSKV